ncbi:hypothetical protein ABZ470_22255 [Streptosporangium sp. NPDC020072]|uniref:hypothetical protein n=1 Tax=Streptosporangium sp. NPDC020072 TaxID=3154788 RepID=UPI00343A638A
MNDAPRSRLQRRHDTEHRLAHDVDLWVASASADGVPYMVPLSFAPSATGRSPSMTPATRNNRFIP